MLRLKGESFLYGLEYRMWDTAHCPKDGSPGYGECVINPGDTWLVEGWVGDAELNDEDLQWKGFDCHEAKEVVDQKLGQTINATKCELVTVLGLSYSPSKWTVE